MLPHDAVGRSTCRPRRGGRPRPRPTTRGHLGRLVTRQPRGRVAPDPSALRTFEQRIGYCYVLAGRELLRWPSARLVHGSIQGGVHPRTGHAWLVLGNGRIWEPILDKTFTRADFKALFRPIAHRSYTPKEANVNMLLRGHFGPWDTPADSHKE